ncbi:MAG: hypothetical protein CM1200mP36_02450 [Gammaproteobacteria bacterium]|nr:MAG: hypothetical protein CM1200mP36_02450 [Gammaproteobacteria bacterium]
MLDGPEPKSCYHMGVKPLGPTEIKGSWDHRGKCIASASPEKQVGVQLGDLLDFGTGKGACSTARGSLNENGCDRPVREMRLVARATVLSQGLANCTVQAGDMYDLSFPEGHFDIVTMDRVLGLQTTRPGLSVRQHELFGMRGIC